MVWYMTDSSYVGLYCSLFSGKRTSWSCLIPPTNWYVKPGYSINQNYLGSCCLHGQLSPQPHATLCVIFIYLVYYKLWLHLPPKKLQTLQLLDYLSYFCPLVKYNRFMLKYFKDFLKPSHKFLCEKSLKAARKYYRGRFNTVLHIWIYQVVFMVKYRHRFAKAKIWKNF
jgi:hypothetical protein